MVQLYMYVPHKRIPHTIIFLSSYTEKWVSDGVLHLRTAFSRDQPEKVYVQHLIRDDSKWLWKLIHQV